MLQAVILVGGRGSRLGALTQATPKPLLPVNGRPFLDYLIEDVARHGFTDVLLLAEFEAEQVQRYCNDNRLAQRFGLRLTVCSEPFAAGTGGALWHARDYLADQFLLMNGDSWINGNYLAVLGLLEKPGTAGAMALRQVDDTRRYGRVAVDDDVVTAFVEKASSSGAGEINAGVYAFTRKIVDFLAPSCSLEMDVLPRLAQDAALRGVRIPGYFIDIGVPDSFEEAQAALKKQFVRPAVFFDRDGVLNYDYGHVGTIERFRWMPGAREAIKRVNDAGWLAFIVTNQAGVAKGLYTSDAVDILHRKMRYDLRAYGAHIDDIRYCPYHIDAIDPEYRLDSPCRKPNPGMILDLFDVWPVAMERSFLIGDKQSDMEAAQRAGIRSFLYDGNTPLDEWMASLIDW